MRVEGVFPAEFALADLEDPQFRLVSVTGYKSVLGYPLNGSRRFLIEFAGPERIQPALCIFE